jgi:anthranilate synthase/aminodeoxychorismate synthase-like glutamine amidotransferase
MKILLIDNYDSFTHNLAHLIHSVSKTAPIVMPYEDLSEEKLKGFEHLFISPGPDSPSAYPEYSFIRNIDIPVTGICLGMQIINELYGGLTKHAPKPLHGKTDTISWRGKQFEVARYHSLCCAIVAGCFVTESISSDGCPMIISHRAKPFTGFQFHPESFMTENGKEFIEYALGK